MDTCRSLAVGMAIISLALGRPAVAQTPRDSIAGRLLVTDTSGIVTISLGRAGQPEVELTGQRSLLRQMNGLHVMAFGRWLPATRARRAPSFADDRVSARAIWEVVPEFDGKAPIYDGILRREAEDDYLEMPDGRRLWIPHLPTVLRQADGRRVLLFDSFETPTGVMIIGEHPQGTVAKESHFARDSVDFLVPPSSTRSSGRDERARTRN